jgi:hypothetical protein
VLLDVWVGESDGPSVVGNDVRNFIGSHGLLLDEAELECAFLCVDFVSLVSSFYVIEESEELSGLLNADYVHDADWVPGVLSDLSVNLDVTVLVLNDLDDFLSGKSVSQSVLKKNAERD